MSKKKAKKQVVNLSPEKYIQTKARSLPIDECLITGGWQDVGECNIIVSRKHTSGGRTIGFFLVDLYCLGVKDCFCKFNITGDEYDEMRSNPQFVPISYEEAHNIIYGAVAYAEDLGIAPYKDFKLAQYVLEPDTDDIPLIEYEFGRDGKPCLITKTPQEASRYLPILKKAVGNDFHYMTGGGNQYNNLDFDDDLPSTTYAYVHPEYPKELKLNHKEELSVCFSPDNVDSLSREETGRILSLPRETLIEDLNSIIFYEIGRTYIGICSEEWDEPFSPVIFHAVLLLGELKAEEGTDAILELMRQDNEFGEYHFGDIAPEILPLSLYYTGRNQLAKLAGFAKEPGLDPFLKALVFTAVSAIATYEPERRAEVIDWFGDILDFYWENIHDDTMYDATLAGMMISDLINIKALELLPKIKRFYDAGVVDIACSLDYEDVETEMNSLECLVADLELMDIYERYDREIWS